MTSKTTSTALNDLLEKDIVPDDVEMQVEEEEGEANGVYINNSNHVPSSQGMCVECGDQASAIACEQCQDDFCDVCFKAMHRKGARKAHTFKRLREESPKTQDNGHASKQVDNNNNNNNNSNEEEEKAKDDEGDGDDDDDDDDDATSEPSLKRPSLSRFTTATTTSSATANYDRLNAFNTYSVYGKSNSYFNKSVTSTNMYLQKPPPPPESTSPAEKYIPSVKKDGAWFEDRAKYIPLRLTMDERKTLRLLEASLHVCDYTDKVDIPPLAASKAKRIVQQLKEICALLCGMRASIDLESGKEMVKDRDFTAHAEFYQAIFEIGRRHKIMNPEKMRTEYGKLIYLLQDSMMPEIQDLIKFSMVRSVMTVHSYLREKGAASMLHDPWMEIATREIVPEGKDRYDIQHEIKQKEKAIKMLSKKYLSADLTSTDIERCLYSIGDNHSFLRGARDPIDKMIVYLTTYFSPDKVDDYSLAIAAGINGARLTHNHARQYHYVLQSLTLWREVTHDMFKLWILAEDDLLESGNNYRLKDTGQGLNRIQSAHRISKAMTGIVHKVQARVGDNWVGSSVVHLGDHNVPNALMFIDKYTQISRILNPIIIALRRAADLMKDAELKDYVEYKFGNLENCKKEILCDFFKFAFDGSGADNFFDAGSCIDGRLTSAWHWCSQIDKKNFYSIFLLTGFIGFDGQF